MSVKRQKTHSSITNRDNIPPSSTYTNKHGSQFIRVPRTQDSTDGELSSNTDGKIDGPGRVSSTMSQVKTNQKLERAPAPKPTILQSNGETIPPGAAVNRKKQKRREKEAAKKAAVATEQMKAGEAARAEYEVSRGPYPSYVPSTARVLSNGKRAAFNSMSHDPRYWQDPMNPDTYGDYGEVDQGMNPSDAEDEEFQRLYPGSYPVPPRSRADFDPTSISRGVRNTQRQTSHTSSSPSILGNRYPTPSMPYMHGVPPPPPPPLQVGYPHQHGRSKDLWNTSTHEERERIKDFWLSLGENERRSLVKVEKEAVLRKMKEQQKHSCTCTVCGRKRTAIEEELEVLYDAYYEELESYAHHQPPRQNGKYLPPTHGRFKDQNIPYRSRPPQPLLQENQARIGTGAAAVQHLDHQEPSDDGQYSEEEEEEDEEEEEEEEYDDSEEEGMIGRMPSAADDFFAFGNALTVQDGILTVADDLLKNDGKKFIEMMEQLAERRMQREEEAQYSAATLAHPSMGLPGHHPPQHNHPHDSQPPLEDEPYDEAEDDEYDSAEDDDYDDDEVHAMTEGQRMEEGRRMFQIFAARMFEQRVLTAYREKVARERQQKLLEELEEEDKQDEQREKKKAKEALKKKDKKARQKALKDEEKTRKDVEKAAEEAAAKAAEEKRLEEQRSRREAERKKREAERKARDDERLRKEADRLKRQQEEREKQADAERKSKELKEKEKKKRHEQQRKEREERENREKAERSAKVEKARAEQSERQRIEKSKADREAQTRAEHKLKEREKKEQQQLVRAQAQMMAHSNKRIATGHSISTPSPGMHPSPINYTSPHLPVAIPTLPRAPSPLKQQSVTKPTSAFTPPYNGTTETHSLPSVAASMQYGASPINSTGYTNHLNRSADVHGFGNGQQSSVSSHLAVSRPPGISNGFYRNQDPRSHPLQLGHPGMFQGPNPHLAGHLQPHARYPLHPQIPNPGAAMMSQPTFIPGVHQQGPTFTPSSEPPVVPRPRDIKQQAASEAIMSPPASQALPSIRPVPSVTGVPSLQSGLADHRSIRAPPKPITRPPVGFAQSRGSDKDVHGEEQEPLGSSALIADDEPDFESQGPAQRQKMMPPPFPAAKDAGRLSAFSGKSSVHTPKSWNMVPTPQSASFFSSPWTPQSNHSMGHWGSVSNGPGSTFPAPQMNKGAVFSSIEKRRLMCEVCDSQMGEAMDGYVEVNLVIEKMNERLPAGHQAIDLPEVDILCDTFGDDNNGGGTFSTREDPKLGRLVRHEKNESSMRQQQRMGSGGLGRSSIGQIGSAPVSAMFSGSGKGSGFGIAASPTIGFLPVSGGGFS